jgi:hypothetical protein
LLKDKDFEANALFFQSVFELGRRHKIRNPEKMRSVYGKMILIVQDSVIPQIQDLMGFHLYAPLRTVYRELEAAGALDLLRDERMMLATGDIQTTLADGITARPRPEIERDIKAKNNAVDWLSKRYANDKINEEHTRACILSIADNHTYLIQNRHCCDEMLRFLTTLYDAQTARTPAHSLAILGGRAGARLTHSHASQYAYVMQSLTLWREILHDMVREHQHTRNGQQHSRHQKRPVSASCSLSRSCFLFVNVAAASFSSVCGCARRPICSTLRTPTVCATPDRG